MSTVRVARIQAEIGDRPTVRVARISAQVGIPTTVRVASIKASTSASTAVRVAKITAQVAVSADLSSRPGPDQFVESFTAITLDGSASTGVLEDFDPPYSPYSWEQVPNGSPTVQLLERGPVVTYRAPPSPVLYKLLFRLTVTDGSASTSATVEHTVYPWPDWKLRGGQWVPIQKIYL